MITNQRQYGITKSEADKFARAISAAEETGPAEGVHPEIHAAMIAGYRSQLEELEDELRAYTALREGKVRRRSITSLLDLPVVLIEGRIAKRMTQRDLALKLNVPEQQVQRYEGNRYSGVSLARLQEIADAIGVSLKKVIDFNLPQPATATGPTSTRRRSATRRRAAARGRSTRSRRAATVQAGGGGSRTKRSTGKAKKASSTSSRKRSTTKTSKRSTAPRAKSGGTKKKGSATTRARTSAKKSAKRATSTRSGRSRTRRSVSKSRGRRR